MSFPTKKISFLALGDSYTIGEKVNPTENWPAQLTQKLGPSVFTSTAPKIIATTGWTTDHLQRAIKKTWGTEKYDLISIAIGVNDQYDGKTIEAYQTNLKALFSTAIAHCTQGKKGVFGLSIPDYSITPFGKEKKPESAKEIEKFNAVFKQTCLHFGVTYFDITPISRLAEKDLSLLAEDQLHPSGKMYSLWVEAISPHIKAKLASLSYE